MLSILLLAAAAPIAMPTCTDPADCEIRWGRAIRWVLDHNPSIVSQNETSVITDEPLGSRRKYQLTKIPDGGGRYTLDLKVACNPFRSCNREKLKREFTAAVMATASARAPSP